MVKNRTELLELAKEFVNEAKNDLKEKINEIIRDFDTDENEIAYALGVDKSEVDKIMRGDGEILLSTLAKILISTDHVVEIKPLSEAPEEIRERLERRHEDDTELSITIDSNDNYEEDWDDEDFDDEDDEDKEPLCEKEEVPENVFDGEPVGDGVRKVHFPFGDMFLDKDGRPCDKYGNVLPPPPGMPTTATEAPVFEHPTVTTECETPTTHRPVRDSRGRFVKTTDTAETAPEEYYGKFATERLKRIINRNHWNSEINPETATRKELIDFIADKERKMHEAECEHTCTHTEEACKREVKSDKIDDMLAQLKNDENLKKAFKGLLSALLD